MTDKAKAQRNQLTLGQKYDLMTLVREAYTKTGETDTGFAKIVSDKLGTEISPSTIKHYREGFGIAQIRAAPVSELKARIAELEAKLAAQGASA